MYKACTGKEKPGASKFYSPRLELIFGSQTTSAAEDTDFAVPKELHLHSASLLFSFQSLPSHLAMWGVGPRVAWNGTLHSSVRSISCKNEGFAVTSSILPPTCGVESLRKPQGHFYYFS